MGRGVRALRHGWAVTQKACSRLGNGGEFLKADFFLDGVELIELVWLGCLPNSLYPRALLFLVASVQGYTVRAEPKAEFGAGETTSNLGSLETETVHFSVEGSADVN